MAVTINKTNGEVLTIIQDGALDNSSTNLSLVGKLYRNYGELINENFVKLLENFASSLTPSTPIIGQLWYDTTNQLVKVYRQNGFISLSRITTASSQPSAPTNSDLWFDTVDQQLKLYNGSTWVVMGPQYTSSQAKSGIFVETIAQAGGGNHVCLVEYQQGTIVSVMCKDAEWTPNNAISGLSTIKPGLNICNTSGQKFVGTATNADALGNIAAANYLRNDINGTIAGSLSVSSLGLKLNTDDITMYSSGNESYFTKTTDNFSFLSGINVVYKVNANSQMLFDNGDETTPTISFIGDTNTGIINSGTSEVSVVANGNIITTTDPTGLFVVNNLTAPHISATDLLATSANISNLNVTDTLTIGSSSTDNIILNSSNIIVNNGLTFSPATITFGGNVRIGNTLTTSDGVSPLHIKPGAYIEGNVSTSGTMSVVGNTTLTNVTSANATVTNNLTIGGMLFSTGTLNFVSGALTIDASKRIGILSTIAPGYTSAGDVTMGPFNGIRAANTAKYWLLFDGTLAGLAIKDSFHVDAITRTSANHYSLTLETAVTSGQLTVVGSNGVALTATPEIGATSFSLTTTSESALMSMVVYSS